MSSLPLDVDVVDRMLMFYHPLPNKWKKSNSGANSGVVGKPNTTPLIVLIEVLSIYPMVFPRIDKTYKKTELFRRFTSVQNK